MSTAIDTPAEPTDREEFHITDESSACWLLRQLANIQAEQQRIKAQAEAMIARLQTDHDRLTHLFGNELEAWARTELLRRGGRRKSLHTLQGSLGFRTVPASVRITDERAALDYARARPEQFPRAVYTEERLRTGVYSVLAKRAMQQTGEVMPGVELIPEREAFRIQFRTESEESAETPE